MMAEAELHIKQIRSVIGAKPKHRGTIRALGLGRIGRVAILPDRPEIRGMVARVTHLVEVSEVSSDDAVRPGRPRKARSTQQARSNRQGTNK